MALQILLLFAALTSIIPVAQSHFVLQVPASLGYVDATEATAPCDGFDPTDRSKGVTSWPVGGSAISFLTTHPSVTWDFKVAKVSDVTTWVSLTPSLTQTAGVGFFCEPQIPGIASWIGIPVVLQVAQHAVDGNNYQCAAIQFAAGAAAATPAACFNSSGFAVHW